MESNATRLATLQALTVELANLDIPARDELPENFFASSDAAIVARRVQYEQDCTAHRRLTGRIRDLAQHVPYDLLPDALKRFSDPQRAIDDLVQGRCTPDGLVPNMPAAPAAGDAPERTA